MSGNASSYDEGQCTWYVASTLSWVPAGLGNAYQWWNNAKEHNLPTGQQPLAGAVAVWNTTLPGSGGYGHVAVVTSVQSGSFAVSEMNYLGGPGVVDTRTVQDNSNKSFSGFIYPPGTDVSGIPQTSQYDMSTGDGGGAPATQGTFQWNGPLGIDLDMDGLVGAAAIAGGCIVMVAGGLVLMATVFKGPIGQAAEVYAPVKAVANQQRKRQMAKRKAKEKDVSDAQREAEAQVRREAAAEQRRQSAQRRAAARERRLDAEGRRYGRAQERNAARRSKLPARGMTDQIRSRQAERQSEPPF